MDRVAGDPASFTGREECHDAGDIVWFGQALQRLHEKRVVAPGVRPGENRHVGLDNARRDRVHPNAARSERRRVRIVPHLEIDNFAMAISLVSSTRGVALLPGSIKDVLPGSVVSRPLSGKQPTIDLMVGYRQDNDSPILRAFLDKLDELLARMAREPIVATVATSPG